MLYIYLRSDKLTADAESFVLGFSVCSIYKPILKPSGVLSTSPR